MKKLFLIGSLLLSFIVGFAVSTWALNDGSADIPYGVYGPFLMMRGLSYQINITLTVIDKEKQTVTTWIREDRESTFRGETGISGQTIYTHLIVDCQNHTVGILEQRGFKEDMTYIGSATGKGIMGPPASLVSISSYVMICGVPKDADPPIEQQQGHPFQLPVIPRSPLIQT